MQVKDSVHDKLLLCYQERGLSTALAVAESLLQKNKKTAPISFKTTMNGELCETVLEILVMDYCTRHKEQTKMWCWGKGLILKDPHKDLVSSEFMTELDFTLFTPNCIYLFECKCYAGNKELVGAGTIQRENSKSFDVYSQSMIHLETLNKWLGNVSNQPEYKLVLFDFSRGKLIDRRGEKAKNVFPCVNKDTWESIFTKGPAVWDMQFIYSFVEALDKASSKLRTKHLEYVKSIHG